MQSHWPQSKFSVLLYKALCKTHAVCTIFSVKSGLHGDTIFPFHFRSLYFPQLLTNTNYPPAIWSQITWCQYVKKSFAKEGQDQLFLLLSYSFLSCPQGFWVWGDKKKDHFGEDWFYCFHIFSYVQIEKHSRKSFGDWCVGTTLVKPLLLWKNCCKPKGLLLCPVILWYRTAVLWLQLEFFLVKMVLE